MRSQRFIFSLSLLVSVGSVFGQTNQAGRLFIPFLDRESQSNVTVIVSDFTGGKPCPFEYTNLISNTNLFTPEEQKLLEEVFVKYNNVTTNSGPVGTVLTSLYKTNFVIMNRTNENWVAHFQYTNSEAQEEIWLGSGISAKFSTKAGDGYAMGIGNVGGGSMLRFSRIKRGFKNGLAADFMNNHLESYMHYTNGMAIGQFFMWDPLNNNLMLEAEFKKPYNFEKHRNDLRMSR